MTHAEIKNSMRDNTLGEYISLAVANGWGKTRICDAVNRFFSVAWNDVAEKYDRYMEHYAYKGRETDYSSKPRKVFYEGVLYDSMSDAARAVGITTGSMDNKLRNGMWVYCYNGKKYNAKKDLLKKEKLTQSQFVTRIDRGEIVKLREMPGFYV